MTSAPLELEIVATSRPNLVQSLRELWGFRGTILAFAERDIRVKYKQAVFGVAWALLQPLAFLAIFAVLVGRVAKIAAVAGLGPLSHPHRELRCRSLGPRANS